MFSSWSMMSSCRNQVALSWTLECCLSLEHVFLFMSKLVLKESRSPCCFQNKIKRMFFSEDSQNLEGQWRDEGYSCLFLNQTWYEYFTVNLAPSVMNRSSQSSHMLANNQLRSSPKCEVKLMFFFCLYCAVSATYDKEKMLKSCLEVSIAVTTCHNQK